MPGSGVALDSVGVILAPPGARIPTLPAHSTINDRSITRMKRNRPGDGFTLVEIMIVVVIIGLLASMAIPAFQKVRSNSQDKAVLNNARQLSAASDQYYLENGVTTVTLTDLVGPTTYIKALNTVAQEGYPTYLTQGVTITITGVAGARTITYAP